MIYFTSVVIVSVQSLTPSSPLLGCVAVCIVLQSVATLLSDRSLTVDCDISQLMSSWYIDILIYLRACAMCFAKYRHFLSTRRLHSRPYYSSYNNNLPPYFVRNILCNKPCLIYCDILKMRGTLGPYFYQFWCCDDSHILYDDMIVSSLLLRVCETCQQYTTFFYQVVYVCSTFKNIYFHNYNIHLFCYLNCSHQVICIIIYAVRAGPCQMQQCATLSCLVRLSLSPRTNSERCWKDRDNFEWRGSSR